MKRELIDYYTRVKGMQDSKLIQFYQTLKKEEYKAWEAFVQSPFFNTNTSIIKLCKLLKKYQGNFTHKNLTREKVYHKIYSEPYNDLKMRKLMSATVKLLEKYWVHQKVETDTFQYENHLAENYYDRALYQEFEKSYRSRIKVLEMKPYKTEKELQFLRNAYHELSYTLNPNRKTLNLEEAEKANAYLWEFAQQQSMFYSGDWNFKKRLFEIATPETILQINEKIVAVSKNEYDELSLAFIYQKVNEMWLEDKEEKAIALFFELNTLLQERVDQLDKTTSHWLFSHLLNFGIRQERMTNFSKVSLFLYELGIANKLFLYRNRISNIKFANTVFQFCLFNKFDLANLFIKEYRSYLPTKHAESYIKIAESYVLFYSGKYQDSFYLLSSFYFKEGIISEIVRRSLLIRSAFECYLIDNTFYGVLHASLNNYDQYLKSDTHLSKEKKKPYLKFNSVLASIIKWKNTEKRDLIALINIKKHILLSEQLMPQAREWLMYHINNDLSKS